MPGSLSSLTIGDFSRATHLSIKTLRYYHRVQLLEPAQVEVEDDLVGAVVDPAEDAVVAERRHLLLELRVELVLVR